MHLTLSNLSALSIFFALLCITNCNNHESRLIVKFNISISQIEQKEYLEKSLFCPNVEWQYFYRSYIPLDRITDIAVLLTNLERNLSVCVMSLPYALSVHVDQPCDLNQRKLMSTQNFKGHKPDTNINGTSYDNMMYFRPRSLSVHLNEAGFRGQGVKVAVFDTGLTDKHPHFGEPMRYDWTDESTYEDYIGHGTFVAGVIASMDKTCGGIAPEVDLYVFRIFTQKQKAYTSWFLDAFNMAITLGIDVLNLSIGGPDHRDEPFLSKIDEMAANGIIVVSAVGNDGPLWGSALNPADQSSVIGVGGWAHGENKVALYSSRGMTTWELPYGVGRVKPDLLAPSHMVLSSSNKSPLGGCRVLSGTSVANPIITAAVALLLSAAKRPATRMKVSNVAAMKQILMTSADVLTGDDTNPTPSICEQGAGVINIDKAYDQMIIHEPHVSLWPARISNRPADCPLLWPYCAHQLFVTSEPLLANITILNSVSSVGHILRIRYTETSSVGKAVDEVTLSSPWLSATEEDVIPHRVVLRGDILMVKVETNRVLWPWVGYVAVAVSVHSGVDSFRGDVSGSLSLLVSDGSSGGVASSQDPDNRNNEQAEEEKFIGKVYEAALDIGVVVTAPPPRHKRVLWDVFHSVSYPSPYVPHDDLDDTRTLLDLLGDHPYSNYRDAYVHMQSLGYTVEILRGPWTCFDGSLYGILIVSDVEENIAAVEMDKVQIDIREKGLSVLIAADWYDEMSLLSSDFYDDNTHSTWFPITGGSHVFTVNQFLGRFGMQFGLQVFDGWFDITPNDRVGFMHGNTLSAWPKNGYILRSQSGQIVPVHGGRLRGQFSPTQVVMGLYDLSTEEGCENRCGRLAVYGDSSFLDMSASTSVRGSSYSTGNRRLLEMIVHFLEGGDGEVAAGGVLEKLAYESFSDDRLMQALSSTQTIDVLALEKERLLREAERARYVKITESSPLEELDNICQVVLL